MNAIKSNRLGAIGIAVSLLAGCASYNMYRPTVLDYAVLEKDPTALKRKGAVTNSIQVTDKHVVLFVNNLKCLLRTKASYSRIARYTSATTQVLSAAAAGVVSVAGGGQTLVAGLAGGSALMPQFQEIFHARDRAKYYAECVSNIEDAESRYITTRASAGNQCPEDRLSVDGARFYQEIVATLKVLENRIADLLPKTSDLEKMAGKWDEMRELRLTFSEIQLETNQTARVGIVGTSDDIDDVAISNTSIVTNCTTTRNAPSGTNKTDTETRFIDLKGLAPGKAEVVIVDRRGRTGRLTVLVGTNSPATAGGTPQLASASGAAASSDSNASPGVVGSTIPK